MIDLPLEIYGDSAAARGIARRRGLGKLRHIELQTLWLQERLDRGAFKLHAIPGVSNPADLFTKPLTEQLMVNGVDVLDCQYRDGRATSAPELRREGR